MESKASPLLIFSSFLADLFVETSLLLCHLLLIPLCCFSYLPATLPSSIPEPTPFPQEGIIYFSSCFFNFLSFFHLTTSYLKVKLFFSLNWWQVDYFYHLFPSNDDSPLSTDSPSYHFPSCTSWSFSPFVIAYHSPITWSIKLTLTIHLGCVFHEFHFESFLKVLSFNLTSLNLLFHVSVKVFLTVEPLFHLRLQDLALWLIFSIFSYS